jgi:hypothetical protein
MSHIVNLHKYVTTFIKTDRQYVINKICSHYALEYDEVVRLFESDTDNVSGKKKQSKKKVSERERENENDKETEEYIRMRKHTDSNGNEYLVDNNKNVYTFDMNNPRQIGKMLANNQIKID